MEGCTFLCVCVLANTPSVWKAYWPDTLKQPGENSRPVCVCVQSVLYIHTYIYVGGV